MVLRIFCLLPRHEVDFGVGDLSVPAKSIRVVELRLAEIEADVLMAGLALLTTAAAVIEWDSDAVTSFEAQRRLASSQYSRLTLLLPLVLAARLPNG